MQTGYGGIDEQSTHSEIEYPVVFDQKFPEKVSPKCPGCGCCISNQCQPQCKKTNGYRVMISIDDEYRKHSDAIHNHFNINELHDEFGFESIENVPGWIIFDRFGKNDMDREEDHINRAQDIQPFPDGWKQVSQNHIQQPADE